MTNPKKIYSKEATSKCWKLLHIQPLDEIAVQEAIDHGADMTFSFGKPILIIAQFGSFDLIKNCIQTAPVNLKKYGENILKIVLISKQPEKFKMFLETYPVLVKIASEKLIINTPGCPPTYLDIIFKAQTGLHLRKIKNKQTLKLQKNQVGDLIDNVLTIKPQNRFRI